MRSESALQWRVHRHATEIGSQKAWMRFRDRDRHQSRDDKMSDTERQSGAAHLGGGETRTEDSQNWEEGITWDILAEEMAVLPIAEESHLTGDQDIREIELDLNKAAVKLGRMRKTAVILQALESTPSRDRVGGWVREYLVLRKGAQVCQVKALTKKEFLIVFKSAEDKALALTRPPCFLDGKIVRFVEWSNRNKEKILKAAMGRIA
ncbi:hypothetical protein R1sor_013357 [Riccia sorocarpa]|uniref:DUF4283 domain-containing protein n=1 Tax=Riccia sorocarpa TaxID=122646 RepID=A0ABD3H6B0_9MARC